MTAIETPPPSGKTETKVKAAAWATFGASLIGTTILEWASTDLIPALPNNLNWAVPIVSSALVAATTWVGGYLTRTRPDSLSQSTVDAIKAWLKQRAPRVGQGGMGGGIR